MNTEDAIGLGYTLGTGKLYCSVAAFHEFAETVMGRPVFTHELADSDTWKSLREAYEEQRLAEMSPTIGSCQEERPNPNQSP